MKLTQKFRDLPFAVAAIAVAGSMGVSRASAQETLGTIATNVKGQLGSIGQLIVAGAVVGGLVMLATGLMKLKQAADTQGQQVKYSEGMWRVAVGAGMIAIPALSGVLSTSFGLGDTPTITPAGGASF